MDCDLGHNDTDVVDLRHWTLELLYHVMRLIAYLAFLQGETLTNTELWYILKRIIGRMVTIRDLLVYIQRVRKLRTAQLAIVECPDCVAVRASVF